MQQRWKSTIAGLLIVGLLLVIPMQAAMAAEGDAINGEETNARGPGAVILMVGIASLGQVGFAYSSRKSDNATNHTH